MDPVPLRIVGAFANEGDRGEQALDAVFAALADPVRRAILTQLDGHERLVSEIAAEFDISLQAVSKHIQVLVRAGLVQQERTGRISRCSLVAGPIYSAAVWLNRYSKYWQEQFDLLAAALGDVEAHPQMSRGKRAGGAQATRRGRKARTRHVTRNRRTDMEAHTVVSRDEWIKARKHLLAEEKEFTKARDQLSRARRELPWVRIDKTYRFDGPNGKETLAELFEGRSQLVIYHFMYGPEMEAPCKSCSFWADNFERIVVHLNARDVTMIAISRSPFARLDAFRQRMGWTFKWVSSAETDFNFDYHVSFTRDEIAKGETNYNYAPSRMKMTELPGISVFYKDPTGAVFHTYSCYARGLDMMNAAYHYLDLVPKGRDEQGSHPMVWVRYRDSYGC